VHKAFKASPEPRGTPDRKDPKDHKAPGEKGAKGEKGDPATNVRAVQSDGAASCDANEILVSVFCPSGGPPDGAKCATALTVGLCLRKS
jgi:hypothetical protein